MSDQDASNELVVLAERITAAHLVAKRTAAEAVERALETAELVAEAHPKVPWSGWERWVRANLPFGPRQANRYVALARRASAIRTSRSELDPSSRFSIREALAGLAAPEPDPWPEPAPEPETAPASSPPEQPKPDLPIELTPGSCGAELVEQLILTKLMARIERWLASAPFGADLADPEVMAAKCSDPARLRAQVAPVYEQVRRLLNALAARLRDGRKPQAPAQPVGDHHAPPGGFLR